MCRNGQTYPHFFGEISAKYPLTGVQNAGGVWKKSRFLTSISLFDFCIKPHMLLTQCDRRELLMTLIAGICLPHNWPVTVQINRATQELSATSTTVTGPVGERFQAGTEDAPVLDRPAPLRRLHDSGAGYKYPDLLTYLLTYCYEPIYRLEFT